MEYLLGIFIKKNLFYLESKSISSYKYFKFEFMKLMEQL